MIIAVSFYNYFFHSSLVIKEFPELRSSELEEALGLSVIGNSYFSDLAIEPVLLHIEDSETGPVLKDPDIVSFLGSLAGPVDGAYLDVLSIICFTGMNDHNDVY